jgi:hypothetical protein
MEVGNTGMTTMRIVGWQVQPVIMKDDGDDLEAVEVKAVFIPAKQWEEFKTGGDKLALEQVQQQIENS